MAAWSRWKEDKSEVPQNVTEQLVSSDPEHNKADETGGDQMPLKFGRLGMPPQRLQETCRRASTSRRKAEELITQGRVSVTARPVTELGSRRSPARPTQS